MTAFWAVAGLMLAGALLFVLPPLVAARASIARPGAAAVSLALHRDHLAELAADLSAGSITAHQYEQARREIERRALDDAATASDAPPDPSPVAGGRWAAVCIAGVVPLLAVGLYLKLGNPAGLDVREARVPAADAKHALTPEQITALVERLAARLRDHPGDGDGWIMLARSYGVLRRYDEAVKAYAAAARLRPDDAQLFADYADMLALTRGRKLAGEPFELVKRALAIDPRNVKALALAGTAHFEGRDYAAAIEPWERILAIVPGDSDIARSINASLAEARAQLATASVPERHTAAPAAVTAAVGGTVTLAESLAGRASPDDTVFVFARAVRGPRMPLAIQRVRVRDLPFGFRLDDAMSMSPEAKLSQAGGVVIGARVSKSGGATATSGDLEGVSTPVVVGSLDVQVRIDRVVP